MSTIKFISLLPSPRRSPAPKSSASISLHMRPREKVHHASPAAHKQTIGWSSAQSPQLNRYASTQVPPVPTSHWCLSLPRKTRFIRKTRSNRSSLIHLIWPSRRSSTASWPKSMTNISSALAAKAADIGSIASSSFLRQKATSPWYRRWLQPRKCSERSGQLMVPSRQLRSRPRWPKERFMPCSCYAAEWLSHIVKQVDWVRDGVLAKLGSYCI